MTPASVVPSKPSPLISTACPSRNWLISSSETFADTFSRSTLARPNNAWPCPSLLPACTGSRLPCSPARPGAATTIPAKGARTVRPSSWACSVSYFTLALARSISAIWRFSPCPLARVDSTSRRAASRSMRCWLACCSRSSSSLRGTIPRWNSSRVSRNLRSVLLCASCALRRARRTRAMSSPRSQSRRSCRVRRALSNADCASRTCTAISRVSMRSSSCPSATRCPGSTSSASTLPAKGAARVTTRPGSRRPTRPI